MCQDLIRATNHPRRKVWSPGGRRYITLEALKEVSIFLENAKCNEKPGDHGVWL